MGFLKTRQELTVQPKPKVFEAGPVYLMFAGIGKLAWQIPEGLDLHPGDTVILDVNINAGPDIETI